MMGYGGFVDYYDMEADADTRAVAASAKAKEEEFIATDKRSMAADAYAEIARRLKELEAERSQ